jgi:hypothetical protein
MRRTIYWLIILLTAISIAAAPALSCGYHSGFTGGLYITHPGSLVVAVAVANARDQKILSANQLSEAHGYRQALADLEQFRRRLQIARQADTRTGFSLVLISSGMWASFQVGQHGVLARYHLSAPIPGQPVLITDESVLRAINSGRLGIDQALELGVIKIIGDETEAVVSLLTT